MNAFSLEIEKSSAIYLITLFKRKKDRTKNGRNGLLESDQAKLNYEAAALFSPTINGN